MLQDCAIKLWNKDLQIDEKEIIKYFTRVAKNHYIDQIRKEQRKSFESTDNTLGEFLNNYLSTSTNDKEWFLNELFSLYLSEGSLRGVERKTKIHISYLKVFIDLAKKNITDAYKRYCSDSHRPTNNTILQAELHLLR